MNLYEVTNGYLGVSYIRVYVWCEDEAAALAMATAAFRANSDGYDPDFYAGDLRVEFLFEATDSKFVTEPSGSGFGKWSPYDEKRGY